MPFIGPRQPLSGKQPSQGGVGVRSASRVVAPIPKKPTMVIRGESPVITFGPTTGPEPNHPRFGPPMPTLRPSFKRPGYVPEIPRASPPLHTKITPSPFPIHHDILSPSHLPPKTSNLQVAANRARKAIDTTNRDHNRSLQQPVRGKNLNEYSFNIGKRLLGYLFFGRGNNQRSDSTTEVISAGGGRAYIPADDLPPLDTEEKTNFMKAVYELQRVKAVKKHSFLEGLPESELGVIEPGKTARREPADACKNLLKDAREDLAKDKTAGVKDAEKVKEISLSSGYRSAKRQFGIWADSFKKRLPETQSGRANLPGGEYGEAAKKYMQEYLDKWVSSPGYSLHNNGNAIDFSEVVIGKKGARVEKGSWFSNWLGKNASKYGFSLNPYINEPWHWEYKGKK